MKVAKDISVNLCGRRVGFSLDEWLALRDIIGGNCGCAGKEEPVVTERPKVCADVKPPKAQASEML